VSQKSFKFNWYLIQTIKQTNSTGSATNILLYFPYFIYLHRALLRADYWNFYFIVTRMESMDGCFSHFDKNDP